MRGRTKRAVDSPFGSGTGVEGSSQPCTKVIAPSKRFLLLLTTTHVLIIPDMCCQYTSRGLNIFFPLQVKNKPCDRDLKHEFILGNCKLHYVK